MSDDDFGSPEWTLKDHEMRLRKLEKHMWVMVGIAGVMSFLGGLASAFLVKFM